MIISAFLVLSACAVEERLPEIPIVLPTAIPAEIDDTSDNPTGKESNPHPASPLQRIEQQMTIQQQELRWAMKSIAQVKKDVDEVGSILKELEQQKLSHSPRGSIP